MLKIKSVFNKREKTSLWSRDVVSFLLIANIQRKHQLCNCNLCCDSSLNPIFLPTSETEIQKREEKKRRRRKKKSPRAIRTRKEDEGLQEGGREGWGTGWEKGGSGVELLAEVVSGVAGGRRRSSSSHLKGRCVYFLLLTNSFMSSKLWRWRRPELLCLCCGGRRESLAPPLPSLWRAAMRNTLERGVGRQAEGE